MNAFRNELQGLVAKHVSLAPAPRLLQLVDLLTNEGLIAPEPQPASDLDKHRFVKLDKEGLPTTGEHVAVYDTQTNLTWLAEPVQGGKEFDWQDAQKAAAGVREFNLTDWRAPTVRELLSIVDYERFDPAVDPEFFKGPYGWTWSSTPAKSPSGDAWGVYLYYGDSLRYDQGSQFHVRAVRVGQSLALGI